ncbi:hypothetical protein F0562_028314 [Nyssa sinensis]|uniref:Uncharacterized protein n=1 Tax=Nyssa sinensis TaxID=561372 RepID=A0A5J5B629_9ASTE|nr:hypothetical protein F0562_028314 [Nyssa sinensis]
MAPRRHFTTADQFSHVISFIPHPRNPPLYRSTTTRTHHLVIQGHKFWPKRYARLDQIDRTLAFFQFFTRGWLPLLSIISPIDEPLVHEFYTNLETIRDQVTVRDYMRGISFDLMPTLIAKILGIPRRHQPGFPYAASLAPREADLIRALRRDRSNVFRIIGACLTQGLFLMTTDSLIWICVGQGVSIYTSDMVRELFGPFTRRTLMQSEHYVGSAVVDTTEDIEANDVAEGGEAVLEEDYLVDQTPPQYHRDPSPPCPFHPDLGAFSSSAPPSVI